MTTEIPHNSLVIVADGERGIAYRNNVNSGDKVSLDEVKVLSPSNFKNDGLSGAQPSGSTSLEIEDATFTKQLAEYLNTEANAGKFDVLILIADPVTLEQLRSTLSQQVKQRTLREFDKTLTSAPIEDIEKLLR